MTNSWVFGFKQFFKAKAFWIIFLGLSAFVVVGLLDAANLVAGLLGFDGFLGAPLFSVFDFVAPFLFLVFLYSWVWIPCLGFVNSKFGWFKQKRDLSGLFGSWVLDKKLLVLLLVVCLVFTGFLAYFPVLNSPGTILVGSDSFHYYEILSQMIQEGPQFVFGSDRPLTYLLLFFVQFVFGFSAVATVQVLPVIVACCLFLAVFWFTRVGTGNDVVSLVCALFSSFSFQLTVSVYAYSLGNWIGLFLVFIVLGLLLKSFNQKSRVFLFFGCLVSFAVFLSHPWTWYALLGSLFLVTVWVLAKNLRNKRQQTKFDIYFLLIFLGVNVLFFVFYSLLPFGGSLVGSANGLVNGISSNFDFSNLIFFGEAINDAVVNWVRGFFVNPLFLLLSIFGLYWTFNHKSWFIRILVFWVFSVSLMMFVVGSANFYGYRLLYLVPFQVFAGLGLLQLLVVVDHSLFSDFEKLALKRVFVVFVGLTFLNYVLGSLSNVPFFVL